MQERQANSAELMIGHMKRLSECGRFFSEIPRITQKRAADIRHMHAQLMGSSGERRKPNQRKALKHLFHGILRNRVLSIGQNGAGKAIRLNSGNRSIDDAAMQLRRTADEREIGLTECPFLHLTLDMRLRKGQFSEKDDAGCFRVEPMNGVCRCAEVNLNAPFQRIASAWSGRGRMALQRRGLLNGDECFVLIKRMNRRGGRRDFRHFIFGKRNPDGFPCADTLIGEERRTVYGDADAFSVASFFCGKKESFTQNLIESQRVKLTGNDIGEKHRAIYRTLLRKSFVRGFCGWSNT